MASDDPYQILNETALSECYREPSEHVRKATLDFLHDFHIAYLKVAPLVCLASGASDGYDVSPRGGEPGFVRVLDRRTLAIPDFPGNNKIETLRNLVRDERIALLFLFPGLDIFMRVAGRATVTRRPELLSMMSCAGKAPITVIVVKTEAVYFHCGRAISRSRIWDSATHIAREAVPSPGAMIKALAQIADMGSEELDLLYRRGMTEELY